MAQTDTRSGFRLPWSSDRAHEDPAGADAADGAPEAVAEQEAHEVAWPETDFAARLGITPNAPRPVDAPVGTPGVTAAPAGPAAPVAQPRKHTKLMADLAAAILATTEAARDQRLTQVDADATAVTDMIRAQSTEGAAALRRRSDDDVDSIRGWAKAEIARIKLESDTRVAERQQLLDRELEGHAVAIEDRVAEVESTVAGYRRAMDIYYSRLAAEDDPARLATMAEAMPDAPALEALADLAGMIVSPTPVETVAPSAEPETVGEDEAPAVAAIEAVTDPVEAPQLAAETPEDGNGLDDAASVAQVEADAAHPAADDDGMRKLDAEPAAADHGTGTSGDDVARWAEGETPSGFPDATEGGDPVDRGSIMAALEAAAEAVVAAEAAAESADQAEAAADVAETAAEFLKGRASADDESDPEANAALSARVDAGGFETESYADRLASLLPGHAEGAADGEPRVTQVVVTGLVSVASIASFKRHLGRLHGVTAVAVASGPDGEFVFNVTHRPDVSFRDGIPTMPGFAARVTASGDGVVNVTARDPETEG